MVRISFKINLLSRFFVVDTRIVHLVESQWGGMGSPGVADVIPSSQLMTPLSGKVWQPTVSAYHANPFMVSPKEKNHNQWIDTNSSPSRFFFWHRWAPESAAWPEIPTILSYDRASVIKYAKTYEQKIIQH